LENILHFKVVGGGPAGLYFAYLMKRSHPGYTVRLIEQNPPDATYGFGVVLSGRALAFLAEGDPGAIERLSGSMQTWSEQHIVHHGELVAIDGSAYSAIERLTMLRELQNLCRQVGVKLEFNHRIQSAADNEDCDVLVAADGANSVVRDSYPQAFDTRLIDLQNYFAWYGVETPYPAHTLTFVEKDGGNYCAHHYRYTPTNSTFVAEVDADTWRGSGMSVMSDDVRKACIERVFAEALRGKKLISNRSLWRRWRLVKNGRWHHLNIVLIGDAQRSAHPSIGSGTRLAMEDAIALWRAFEAEGSDILAAFRRYEGERRPVRDKLNKAAERSIAWYENVGAKMRLSPYEFAHDYMLRTGVMTSQRLAKESPDFMKRYATSTGAEVRYSQS
jgi:2-polyprenyl-6-methoxyphenol hydroxylase-like FAD-dependent oxidoreductase